MAVSEGCFRQHERNLFKGDLRPITTLLWLAYIGSSMAVYFKSNWGPIIFEDVGFTRTQAAMIMSVSSIGGSLAGLALKPETIADFGQKARYFNTFGGNAVAAATAMAVLEVVQTEALQENARTTGAYFREGLQALAKLHPCLGEVRAAGLFLGVEIINGDPLTPDAPRASRIVNALRAARVLISATGPRANVLKIRPPLVFSRDNVDYFLDRFESVLKSI